MTGVARPRASRPRRSRYACRSRCRRRRRPRRAIVSRALSFSGSNREQDQLIQPRSAADGLIRRVHRPRHRLHRADWNVLRRQRLSGRVAGLDQQIALFRPGGRSVVLAGGRARFEAQPEPQPHPGLEDRAPVDHSLRRILRLGPALLRREGLEHFGEQIPLRQPAIAFPPVEAAPDDHQVVRRHDDRVLSASARTWSTRPAEGRSGCRGRATNEPRTDGRCCGWQAPVSVKSPPTSRERSGRRSTCPDSGRAVRTSPGRERWYTPGCSTRSCRSGPSPGRCFSSRCDRRARAAGTRDRSSRRRGRSGAPARSAACRNSHSPRTCPARG